MYQTIDLPVSFSVLGCLTRCTWCFLLHGCGLVPKMREQYIINKLQGSLLFKGPCYTLFLTMATHCLDYDQK